MKSNPYVYPFVPFGDLTNKTLRAQFLKPTTIGLAELKKELQKIKFIAPKITGNSSAQKIFSIFLDSNYRFGPREFLGQNKEFWLAKLNYFIDQKAPIQFTLLGFPFKMPVPIKTERTLPDMGEVMALWRVFKLIGFIKRVYAPGAVVTIFTEGAFGRFTGVATKEWVAYRKRLAFFCAKLGLFGVKIKDLSDVEKEAAHFNDCFTKRVKEFKTLYQKKDSEFIKKYQGTWESVFRIVNVAKARPEILMDAYNLAIADQALTPPARKLRKDIQKRTHESIFNYHAYLKARDDVDYLALAVPNALALSVSPKPGRLGVLPVNKECKRLPYHGVVVYNPIKKQYLIEYLIDLERTNQNFLPVHLRNDPDPAPFYFVKQ